MKQAMGLLVLCIIIFGSCTPAGIFAERFGNREKTLEENIITALIPEPDSEIDGPSGSSMILENGNYWTAGVPGFGENALSAFAGEYRVPGATETIKVWLTMEFIYYENWSVRNSITRMPVQEKMGYEGLIIASTINDNWTVVMLFPLGSGLSRQEEDRIIIDLISKFNSFSGQTQNISFPALIPY